MRILMVEDHAPLAFFLNEELKNDHLPVDIAANSGAAKRLLESNTYDLVILDLSTPLAERLEMLREFREAQPDMHIFLLTDSPEIQDRVRILDAGADDCLGKPFYYAELAARVRAILRRSGNPTKIVLKVEDLELDRIGRTARRGTCPIPLTQKEFELLEFLMRRPLQPVSRKVITEQAWKLDGEATTNVVDVYINYLRKKVDSGFERPLIRTIRGVGYQIGG